ncbi:glycosyltransferase 87 family protein [Vermiculatibacterium agrestimuris]|uniref:glycosyltransferase 87 family protein n=1 Tax=Vermiculatibacterium agrestimuris TaxID=2941519 RepID=UPI002040114F|nr:conjugal transfer protein TraL [Vermiculatibacterium agrestimuris]
MSTHQARPASRLGLLLTALALVRCYGLGGSALGKLLLPLCFLALGALAVYLLFREGCDGHTAAVMLLPIGLALLLRALLLPHATLDYQDFLSQWVEHFRQNGGLLALKDPVGNYNVPYLYLLALISYLPMSDLYLIKLFSILFDVLLAWGGFRLAKALTGDDAAPLFAFTLLLLLPTVILNGACWGQCDSVWAALCVHALAAALEDRPRASLALLALAFSFKLQAIFLIPLWAAFWFTGRMKLRDVPVFPAVFVLTMLPAMAFGKPAGDILRVYLSQASDSVGWQTLNYNSPSVFTLFPYRIQFPQWAPRAAILLAFLFMAGVLIVLFIRRNTADNSALALAGAALSLGIPFFLPYMHERYFFLGGVLLCVLACVWPALVPGAAGAELASLGGYHAYLMKRYIMTLSFFGLTWTQLLEGLLMLFALVFVTAALLSSLWPREPA